MQFDEPRLLPRLRRFALAVVLTLSAHAAAAAQVWKGSNAPPPKPETKAQPKTTTPAPAAPARARRPAPAARPAPPPVTFQYRVLKVSPNGTQLEVSPITVFEPGDRIRFGFKASEDGYVHVIRQRAPDRPGQILLPDARINGGVHQIKKGQEFTVPSDCAPGTPAWACTYPVDADSGSDFYTIIFSRDRQPALPPDAADANGDLKPQALQRHWAASRQRVSTQQRGDTIFSTRVLHLNPGDSRELIIRYLLNKAGRKKD